VTAVSATAAAGSRALPPGWRWTALSDLGPLTDGDWILNQDYAESGIRLLQVGDVGHGEFRDRSSRFVSEQTARDLNCTLLEPGDVLISRMPDPLGRACRLPDLAYPCITAVDVSIWRPDETRADRDFLTFYLASSEWLSLAASKASGATRPRISRKVLEALPVPLPPMPEQQRIAAALREQLNAAARMRTAAERQLAVADRLAKSMLNALFEKGQLESWPEASLPEVADIVAGVTLGRRLDADEVRMIAYLRVANVKDGRLDLADLTETPATEAEIARLKLRAGDLVLTEGGDPDKLGRGSIWSNQVVECIHQNHIFRVRLNRDVANPVFVSAQFGSAYGKAYFARHAKQTTGIASINQRVLKAFPLRLPALPVQDSIAREHDALVEAQRRLDERVRETQELVGRLPAALLRSAFSGDSPDNL